MIRSSLCGLSGPGYPRQEPLLEQAERPAMATGRELYAWRPIACSIAAAQGIHGEATKGAGLGVVEDRLVWPPSYLREIVDSARRAALQRFSRPAL